MEKKQTFSQGRYLYAREEDFPAVIALWQEAFGDSEAEIRQYLSLYYTEGRILLYQTEQGLAAMASLFPLESGQLKAIYIYAFATAKAFRGQGIGTALLDHIQARSGRTLLLQPEQNGVADYYRARGFLPLAAAELMPILRAHELIPLTLGEFDGFIRPYPAPVVATAEEARALSFRELLPDDMQSMLGYADRRPNKSCSTSPLCLYLYRHVYRPSICFVDDACLLLYTAMTKSGEQKTGGALPFCRPELLPRCFALQERYFNEVLGQPHTLFSADEDGVRLLQAAGLLSGYQLQEEERSKDYLYDADSLRTLAGSKYSKKRNLIHQFLHAHEGRWAYCRLTAADREDILAFLEDWRAQHGSHGESDRILDAETQGIREIVRQEQFFPLFRFGGIRIDGSLKAFSIGAYNAAEKMAIIDVEKADPGVTGLYQLINREFLLHEFPEAELVNREDDLGQESLRHAKMSYHPLGFARKFTLRQRWVE